MSLFTFWQLSELSYEIRSRSFLSICHTIDNVLLWSKNLSCLISFLRSPSWQCISSLKIYFLPFFFSFLSLESLLLLFSVHESLFSTSLFWTFFWFCLHCLCCLCVKQTNKQQNNRSHQVNSMSLEMSINFDFSKEKEQHGNRNQTRKLYRLYRGKKSPPLKDNLVSFQCYWSP